MQEHVDDFFNRLRRRISDFPQERLEFSVKEVGTGWGNPVRPELDYSIFDCLWRIIHFDRGPSKEDILYGLCTPSMIVKMFQLKGERPDLQLFERYSEVFFPKMEVDEPIAVAAIRPNIERTP